jgi:hypothetical protein
VRRYVLAELEELTALRDNPTVIVPVRRAAARAVEQIRREELPSHTCSRCGKSLTDETDQLIDSGLFRHRRWCVDVIALQPTADEEPDHAA